jgi:hypothetical protein
MPMSPLDALAPDQRAVVQLVLGQHRSYSELADLLGIQVDAVRQRAWAGLAKLGADVPMRAEDAAPVADFLLGQQDDTARAATARRLSASARDRAWAHTVASALADIRGASLPTIPAADPAVSAPTKEHALPRPAPAAGGAKTTTNGDGDGAHAETTAHAGSDGNGASAGTRAVAGADDNGASADAAAAAEHDEDRGASTATAERDEDRAAEHDGDGSGAATATLPSDDDSAGAPHPEEPAAGEERARKGGASRTGGVILLVLLLAALVGAGIWLYSTREDAPAGATSAITPEPTETAAPATAVGQIELTHPTGGRAEGVMLIYASDRRLQFTLEATGLRPNPGSERYAVWFRGGNPPALVGVAEAPLGAGETFGVAGPPADQLDSFPRTLATHRSVIVTREDRAQPTEPGPTVLRGRLPGGGS